MPHCLRYLLVSACFGGIDVARKQLMLSNNVGALQKHFLPAHTNTRRRAGNRIDGGTALQRFQIRCHHLCNPVHERTYALRQMATLRVE